jgi:pyridoxal phosphate enzyme (YggS family)
MIASNLSERYLSILNSLPSSVTLIVVSKFHPAEAIQQVYDAGQRIFGENRVQEMVAKKPLLPEDIRWHAIGTLQSNKVKYIAPFVSLIQSVDNLKLLAEIDKQAKKNNRVIECLLEVHIAQEQSKHGFSIEEADSFLSANQVHFEHVKIVGLMGMATYTENTAQVRTEFRNLASLYKKHQQAWNFKHLSMGMSNDYKIAIEEGSTMVRIGSSIFGERTGN